MVPSPFAHGDGTIVVPSPWKGRDDGSRASVGSWEEPGVGKAPTTRIVAPRLGPALPWGMPPPPSFVRGYVVRGVILWMALHLGAGFVSSLAGSGFVLFLRLLASAFLVGAVFVACLIDDRVRRDDLYLANLGVPPTAAAGVSAGTALILEMGMLWAGRGL
jgi:hypothetical protein